MTGVEGRETRKSKTNLLESRQSAQELKEMEANMKLMDTNKSVLQCASLIFKDSESSQSIESKPFIRCRHNIKIQGLVRHVLHSHWKLNSPKIIVLLASNASPLVNWPDDRQIKSFQKGLMKAAESTNMWVVLNGYDIGSTNMIGEAITNYSSDAKHKSQTEKNLMKSKFIGIADEEMLRNISQIISDTETISNKTIISSDVMTRTNDEKQELNPNLTHYILLKDETINKNGINIFINNFVQFLSLSQRDREDMQPMTAVPLTPNSSTVPVADELCSIETSELPVVTLIIKGGIRTSRLIYEQIRNKIPVVVLKGSGGLADLLAFVELSVQERRLMDAWDPEFVETYLKPELTLRIGEMYSYLRTNNLLRNQYRNRILETVRESRKDGQNYLTVINMFDNYSCDLEKLSEYLLSALFRAQRTQSLVAPNATSNIAAIDDVKPNAVIIKTDLNLCVDWNCPEVAKKQVLSKDTNFSLNSEKKLFEESLIRSNRHAFVDMFLSQKFKIRAFVSPKRLKRMFRKIHSRDFFSTICWCGILGRTQDFKQTNSFLKRELNWLVEVCTGVTDFFNEDELGEYVLGQYQCSDKEAERKALTMLVFWALFDFRKELVQILWKHSDQPIHLALIIAMSYDQMSWYTSDQLLCDDLKAESKQFVNFATEVLDKCYKDSFKRADHVLNESYKDWEFRTPVDLAAFSKLREFFNHTAVQRYLNLKFSGNIEVMELSLKIFRFPILIKLLLSAYFIVPMYWWIHIVDNDKKIETEEEEVDDDDEDVVKPKLMNSEIESQMTGSSNVSDESSIKQKPNLKHVFVAQRQSLRERITGSKVPQPFCTLLYETWNSPMTKFWNFQLLYTAYLSLFSYAVLYPRCGNIWLDWTVIMWTCLNVVDQIRQVLILRHRFPNKSFTFKQMETVITVIFLAIYISSRFFNEDFSPISPYDEKVILCLALLHAYYKLFSVYLPISLSLGPLIYRLKLMIAIDFINFIRLSILAMMVFGVIIQTILYPDMEITWDLARRAISRAVFSLFLTPSSELEVDRDCDIYYRNTSYTELNSEGGVLCSASVYTNSSCRVTGVWPYIFEISYFILLKLILLTLLFAMFAMSTLKYAPDTDTIWRYQRYALVVDFETRAPMPPPMNIFYYLYQLIVLCLGFIKVCCSCTQPKTRFKDYFLKSEVKTGTKLLSDDDFNYMRGLAVQTYEDYKNKISPEDLAKQEAERNKANSQSLELTRQTLRHLMGRMSAMERNISQTSVYLETIRRSNTKGGGIDSISNRKLHILSRYSPYPNTSVRRYPVADSYVSWDVMWIDYDPNAYTKPKEEFTVAQQEFVDVDLLKSQVLQLEKSNQVMPVLEWNRMSSNAAGITVDRQSWEEIDGQKVLYKLDNGIPVNPFGRTGLVGKGSLVRWGPNHFVMTIITRQNANILEVLVEKINVSTNKISLIVRFIPGECAYVDIESLFKVSDPQYKEWKTPEKMIGFFKSWDSADEKEENYKPNLKIKGPLRSYFDDPLNTDQAWQELEYWHFQYSNQTHVLNEEITDKIEWREVTESFISVLSLSQSNAIQKIVDELNITLH